MTRKPLVLVVLAAVLGGVFLYANRDWFLKAPIQISHRSHAFAGRFGNDSGPAPVLFEFSRKLKLTSVKVVPIGGNDTNKSARALWYLTTDSNSVPTKGFVYGMSVPGMRPFLKGATADPLEPGSKYRLLIQAGSLKAQHDFDTEP